jgi:hypothetical protein
MMIMTVLKAVMKVVVVSNIIYYTINDEYIFSTYEDTGGTLVLYI